jgi:hypothetical protein
VIEPDRAVEQLVGLVAGLEHHQAIDASRGGGLRGRDSRETEHDKDGERAHP